MGLNRAATRFDKRLITRNLREGTITLEELNQYLAETEDVTHLAVLSDSEDSSRSSHPAAADDDYEDEDEEDEDEDES